MAPSNPCPCMNLILMDELNPLMDELYIWIICKCDDIIDECKMTQLDENYLVDEWNKWINLCNISKWE
jgi:hypothetical protein